MNKNLTQTVKKELQEALTKGWLEFHDSDEFKFLAEYSDDLRESGFFESKYRKIIPHPGHDNAAKAIGKYFLKTLIKLEINVDQFFPGDFDKSTETTFPDYQLRNFFMTVFYKTKPLCLLKISYPHKHDSFAFPATPVVSVEKEF